MNADDFKQHTTTTVHPMEELFNLPVGSTQVTSVVHESAPLVDHVEYDSKDNELEQQFQAIYDAALGAFADQAGLVDKIDPKFAARSMEVANAFLNTALAATKERASLKHHKDALVVKQATAKSVTNNTTNIIADRNDLLRMFKQTQAGPEPIDVTPSKSED